LGDKYLKTLLRNLQASELPSKVTMLPIYFNLLLFMPAALLSLIHVYLNL